MDLALFKQKLFIDCGVTPGSNIVVGVSGGPDSLTLLDLISQCEVHVIAAHFNHQLREEADKDEKFVKDFCRSRKITFASGKGLIRTLAEKNKRSIEEQARISRYEFLFGVAKKEKAVFIAVGHNADDQVETVLMHLLRGSGLAGLTGMEMRCDDTVWGGGIVLIRPLLKTWRVEIKDYCTECGLTPIQDLTNTDSVYFRNRIRNELIPYLETYNPGIKNLVFRMSNVLAGDLAVVESALEMVLPSIIIDQKKDFVILDRSKLMNLTIGLQRKILKECIQMLYPDERDVDFEIIERAREFIEKNRGNEQHLFRDLYIETENETVTFRKAIVKINTHRYPQIDHQIELETKGTEIEIDSTWKVNCVIEKQLETPNYSEMDPYTVIIDKDKVQMPIYLGTSKPGERFAPLGMKGKTLKLSDFWINRKIPKKYRENYALVYDQDGIIWIPGYQTSEKVRVDESTRTGLRISLVKVK